MKDFAADVLEGVAAVIGYAVAAVVIGAFVIGGLWYRTECPSKVDWSFQIIPFIASNPGDESCEVDTATSYYVGEIPVVGGPLQVLVRSIQQ